jgi:hypothetical protein
MRTLYAAAFTVMTVILAVAGVAYAYDVPDVASSRLIFEEKQLVADKTPRTEILIRTYKKDDGKLFRTYSVNGKVFRYDIDEDGAAPYEYRLLDNDGDGKFETKEKLVGETAVNEKGQRYFIDLGPEPGKEYKYSYEKEAGKTNMRQEAEILQGYSIYIPAWVLVRY